QRRYGLDGKEIVIYKFRTMTVLDDGNVIKQATRNDRRVTRLGALLRQYSLDELPQFFNVLQGRMSVVGPRPHAVAHNEVYRRLIKGYMIRHKVRPGITGLAQVNGLRGETDTLDKMQSRIEHDLDYLRNWPPQRGCEPVLPPWKGDILDFRGLPCSARKKTKLKSRGGGRNRTGVHGFAGRCMTTLPPRRMPEARNSEGYRNGLFLGILER